MTLTPRATKGSQLTIAELDAAFNGLDTRTLILESTPPVHVTRHAPGGADPLPWTTIHGRGTTAAKPAAAAGNSGYLYFDTDLAKLQRSNGSSWQDVSEAAAAIAWGAITGTLASQSDLQAALDAKSGTGHNHSGVYCPVTSGASILKGDGAGGTANAVANTDYAAATHEARHEPNGADALPWSTIHGRGTTAARPAAAAGNLGYLYFDTTLGALYRSNGSSWDACAEAVASVAWGSVTGTLANQTDLQTALNAKSATTHNHTGTYCPITSGTGILKGDGSGGTATAVSNTDYAAAAHASRHLAGGADAITWTTVHGRGTTAAKPTADSSNAGYLYFDTTLGKLQRSTGTTWEDVSEAGGGSTATYWTATAEAALSAEVNLGALTTGLLKHTVTAGVSAPATAVPGTDYDITTRNTWDGTGNYTVSGTGDQIIELTAALGAARTFTFPAANGRAGQRIRLIAGAGTFTQTNKVTPTRAGSDTFGTGGATSYDLVTPGGFEWVSDGSSKWFLMRMSPQYWDWTSGVTWTSYPATTYADVLVQGGGAGGGNGGTVGGAGGGAGEFVRRQFTLPASTSVVITIGAAANGAGSGATPAQGTTGNTSSFGSYVSAAGGNCTNATNASINGPAAMGRSVGDYYQYFFGASGAYQNSAWLAPTPGYGYTGAANGSSGTANRRGGGGGTGFFGNGGAGANGDAANNGTAAAANTGGGGGGAGSTGATGGSGGNGGSGRCVGVFWI